MDQLGLPYNCLVVEITENITLDLNSKVNGKLEAFRNGGVQLALDDFGTGYSSLSYLQDLPLDVLKIDRAFVSRLQSEQSDQSLANTIVLLATGLGLDTVAEGVETVEQRNAIVDMGCNTIQGYFYSPPVSAGDLPAVIEKINPIEDNLRRAG